MAAASVNGAYKVQYYRDGQKHIIRRSPPRKLHPVEVNDQVTITHKRNQDWDVDDNVRVMNINKRHPNTLQVTKDDGSYTFLSCFDVKWEDKEAQRWDEKTIVEKDAVRRAADPIGSNYLLWP